VAEFCSRGSGIVTALSDVQLRTLRGFVEVNEEIDFVPFGAAVSMWARLAGEEPRPIAQTGHFLAALREACESLQPDSPFFKCRSFPGFHECLAAAIKELAAWGFEADSLEALAHECSPTLAAKLRSIVFLQREAEEMLAELGRELNDKHIGHCVDSEPEEDVSFPRCLLIAGTEATPRQIEWMNWAARVGTDITVVTVVHPPIPSMYPAGRHYEKHLTAEASQIGKTTGFLDALFTDKAAAKPELEVAAFYAADPLAEVEWALRGCFEAAMEGDWRELGIYARNLEEYAPLIESAALRLQVPIHLVRRAPLITNSLVRILLQALQCATSDDVRTILKLCNSSYLRLTHAQRKEIRDATMTAHRQGDEQWTAIRAWAETNRETYPWLVHLLEWRSDSLESTATMGMWIESMRDLANGMTWIEAIGHSMARDLRAKSSLERALAQRASIENIRERSSLSLTQFVHYVGQVADEADTSLPATDGVQVASSAEAFGRTRRLYVLGMLEGVFPRRRSEDPVLTDGERHEIAERRNLLFPLPDSFEIARAERDEFLSVCAVPAESIVFSYPETTDDRDNIPAFYLQEIQRVLGGKLEWPRHARQELAPALADCRSVSDKELRTALDDPKTPPIDVKLTDSHTRETLVPDPEAPLAPRELRTAIECPFRHFATALLKLYPDRERRRWHGLRDLPQTAQLGVQPTEEAARSALLLRLLEEVDKLKAEVGDWELKLLERGGERLIEEWIDREFTARALWPKDEGSQKPQTNFGQDGLRGELPRVGKIKGSVAGVSRMGPYNVVHLVESSPPSPDKTSMVRLKDRDALYYGLHLLAAFERDSATAIEVESMSGGRKLLVLPRLAEPPLVGDIERGLEVFDLGSEADPAVVRKVFFDKVKELLEKASKAIREVDVRPTRGEHCTWCDHGELCRNSSQFGEEESPFEGEDGD